MPLLFAISGFLIYDSLNRHWSSLIKWIKLRAYGLLLPCLLFNVVLYYFSKTDLATWRDLTQKTSYLEWLRLSVLYDYGEWFLWTLFIASLLLIVVHWLGTRFPRFPIVLTGVVAMLLLLGTTVPNNLLKLCYVQYYFTWALMGYVVARYKLAERIRLRTMWYAVPMCLCLYVFMMHVSQGYGGWGGKVPITALASPFWTLTRYLQAATILPLVVLIGHLLGRVPKVSTVLTALGKITIGIYLFSLLFTNVGIGTGSILVLTGVLGSLTIAIALSYLLRPPVRRISALVRVRA